MAETATAATGTSESYADLLRAGSTHGVISWIVGIVISFILFRSPRLSPGQGIANANIDIVLSEVPGWKLAAYTYYGGHFVKVTPEDLMYSATNLASHFGGLHLLAYLLPAVVLGAAGYHYTQSQNPTSVSAARVYGASIVGGYALLMLAGVFLFAHSQADGYGNQWALSLPVVRTLIVGTIYPLMFGAIGGHLAYDSA